MIINNRDRLTPVKRLIEWLWEAGHQEIVILDNLSTYPPLLDYYRRLARDRVKIVRLGANLGPLALWKQPDKSLLQTPFVLTDSDCVPVAECPLDLLDFLWRAGTAIRERYQSWGHPNPLQKIGPAFKLSTIPDTYRLKPWVLKWERYIGCEGVGREQFEGVEIYDAAIDTAFALYFEAKKPGYSAVRVGAPFLIDHLDWHVNSDHPTDEEAYYEQHAVKGNNFHNWGVNKCYHRSVVEHCKEITLNG